MSDTNHRDRTSRRGFLKTLGAAGATAVAGTACAPSAQPPATGPGADVGVRARQRPHPHDRRARHRGRQRRDSQRRVRERRRRRGGGGAGRARHRSRRAHRRPRAHRAAHSQREPREPAGLPHDPREHDVDSRSAGSAGRAAQGRSRGPMDHVDGRLASEPVGRAPPPDARGARRGRARSAGVSLRALHGPVRREQPREEVLRRGRCRGARASGSS